MSSRNLIYLNIPYYYDSYEVEYVCDMTVEDNGSLQGQSLID